MPTRYFAVNQKTDIMHTYGCCQQTKVRKIPIRLFDSPQELEAYTGKKMTLCVNCQKYINEKK